MVGTKDVWGGTTKDGIRLLSLMRQLLSDVYHVNVPRTSLQQFYTKNIKTYPNLNFLAEGDLLFFKEKGQGFRIPCRHVSAEPLVP